MEQILFARVELTGKALRENVGGDMNKRIMFYLTDGNSIRRVGDEAYTRAKEKELSRTIIFMPEKIPETLSVKHDISSIRLVRE